MRVIKNVSIYDFDSYTEGAFVAFDGTIVKAAPMSEYQAWSDSCGKECTTIDGQGRLLMPGLVLGHTHIYSTFARGWQTHYDPHSFQDILDQLWWKLDSHLGRDEIYYSALAAGVSYLKHGITCVIDHHASGRMIKGSLDTLKKALVDEIGLRGIFCFETSDRFDTSECISENIDFYQKMKDEKCQDAAGLFGFHASFSLSDETLRKAADASLGMPIHIHVAESAEDVVWTKEHCGRTIIGRLNDFGLMREGSLYVHGVYLEEKDLSMIKEKGGIMAFNPSSNMNNGVGLPPVVPANRLKVPWVLGNDGLGFGLHREVQNLLFSSNLQKMNSADFDKLKKSFDTAYDYASTLLGTKLGRIREGYSADFVLLDYDPITPMNSENAFSHFVYGIIEQFYPEKVWCKGELTLGPGSIKSKHNEIMKGAQLCAAQLWREIR